MNSGSIYTNSNSTSQTTSQDYLSNAGIPSSTTNYILPRQVGTGSTRGTQTIGVGNINIDGSNNQITITNGSNSSSIILGQQSTVSNQSGVAASSFTSSNGAFGLSVTDSNNASINLGINASGNVELLFDDGTTNRLLVGQNSKGQEVISISKPGIDVTTADISGLSFSSTASFTVVLQGSFTFPSLGTVGAGMQAFSSVQTFPHNVGYIPDVNVFGPLTVGGFTLPDSPPGFPSATTFAPLADNTSLIYQSNLANFGVTFGIDAQNLYLAITFNNDEASSQIALPLQLYYTVYNLPATA